jgi:hypothetical protein
VKALQERCREQRRDNEAIEHLSAIFANGMNPKALKRKVTKEEIVKHVFGTSAEPRQVYWALLGQGRVGCRLCLEEIQERGGRLPPHMEVPHRH